MGMPIMDNQVPPWLLSQASTYEFDLRQHKTNTNDWRRAFLAAVRKRVQGHSRVALTFSDGYDSGSISLALGELRKPHALYAICSRTDIEVVKQRVEYMTSLGLGTELTLGNLSTDSVGYEDAWIRTHMEEVAYSTRNGTNFDDTATIGLSWLYRQASRKAHRLFLTGHGNDEVMSDYGMHGSAMRDHSSLHGTFPKSLGQVFPWRNFYCGTQHDYLAKEEVAAGAHGVETRYPFLDRALVQEYLWLAADLKNVVYKAPLRKFMEGLAYPFLPDMKRGFVVKAREC